MSAVLGGALLVVVIAGLWALTASVPEDLSDDDEEGW